MPMTLTKGAREGLAQLVTRHAPEAAPDLDTLMAMASEEPLGRGDRLLTAGAQADRAGFIVSGLVGEFYENPDGQRKAKWLAKPGDVVGSLEDLVRGGPARASVEALADSVVVCVPYRRLRSLAVTEPAWAGFFVSMIESLYRRKSEREFTLLMLRADDRYRWFLQYFGDVEPQLSQETVASYLGITSVHLSRVRKAHALAR